MSSIPLICIIVLLHHHTVWCYNNDDLYQLPPDLYESLYYTTEDYLDEPDEIYRHLINDNNNNNNDNALTTIMKRHDSSLTNNLYDKQFPRPTRSGQIGDKNDHFIRFGRNKQDFLRFGRRAATDNGSNYIRFGRSVDKHYRNKRDTSSMDADYKRSGGNSNFLRFGRNSNFLRFGRNNNDFLATVPSSGYYQQYSPLIQLLEELMENVRKQPLKNKHHGLSA